jgi:hypothetical protein
VVLKRLGNDYKTGSITYLVYCEGEATGGALVIPKVQARKLLVCYIRRYVC